jgi:hypothetical protein
MYKFPSGKKTMYSDSTNNMSQTINAKRKLPPLSAMADYDTAKVAARCHTSMGAHEDPFYKVEGIKVELPMPKTQASGHNTPKYVVGKNPKTGLKI